MSEVTDPLWEAYREGLIGALPSNLRPLFADMLILGTAKPANLAFAASLVRPRVSRPQALFEVYRLGNTLARGDFYYQPSSSEFFSLYATYIDQVRAKPSLTTLLSQNRNTVDQIRKDLMATQPTLPNDEMVVDAGFSQLVVPRYIPDNLVKFSLWADGVLQNPTPPDALGCRIGCMPEPRRKSMAGVSFFSVVRHAENVAAGELLTDAPLQQISGAAPAGIDPSDPKFSADIHFAGLTSLAVRPGPWYKRRLMYDYPEQGLRLVDLLLVVLKPSIIIKCSRDNHEALKQLVASKPVALGIGNLLFALNESPHPSALAAKTQIDSRASEIRIRSDDPKPLILGVSTSIPGA